MILIIESLIGLAKEFKDENGFDVKNDKMALQRLKMQAENAKRVIFC